MPQYKDEKRGTWYFRTRKRDVYGNVKEITRRGFKTKSEAKEAEAKELLKEVKPSTFITFETLYTYYCNYAKGRLKERTFNIKDDRIKNHVLPYFKSRQIDKITTNDITKWQEELDGKKYSYQYKKTLHNTFSSIMNYAIKYHGLKINPLSVVGNFKDRGEIKKEMLFFTKEEFDTFIKQEEDLVYKTFFIVLYYTGIRLGEALALNWNDIKKDTLEVKKSLSNKVKGKAYAITTPKTKSSIRGVLLSHNVIENLKELKKYYKKYDGFNNDWFVFGGIKPLSETSIRRHKINACKKAKVKEIRIHDFRHSHASLLISLGADALLVSKRLGHSNIAETLNTYSHLYPNKQQEIVNLLNKI